MPSKDLEKQRQAAKRYREKYPNEIRERKKKDYQKHKEQRCAHNRQYVQEHLAERREYQREYDKKNRELVGRRHKIWRDKNKERVNELAREGRKRRREKILADTRNHVLTVNGKPIRGLNKRSYTGCCELSGQKCFHLDYHHWDDNQPEKGVWTSYWPHKLCELVDVGQIPLEVCSKIPWAKKYLELKEEINAEYALSGIK